MVTENRVEFRVEGEEGVGTTVTIRIPCLQEGKTDAESIAFVLEAVAIRRRTVPQIPR